MSWVLTKFLKDGAVTAAKLGSGAVGVAALAAGALAATAAGRAVMATGFFNAATVLDKFGTDSFTNAVLLQLIQDGAFSADANTRALFANAFLPSGKLQTVPVKANLAAGAEAANAIAVTLTTRDMEGTGVARTQRYIAEVYSAAMLLEVTANTTITVSVGTAVSTNARAAVLFDTDASGNATLTVTDVTTALAGTLYLVVRPVCQAASQSPGVPAVIALTFA